MHFNATVTGYFTLPHKLFTSTLPLGIYLGDFGSSLFFIVSGASLALTVPAEQNPAQFYKRRARAVYPLFWLAWFVVFSYRFVAHPGSFGGARTVTLVLTLLGLDNFAVAAGLVGTDFACVGEWFLGSILFLYLLFPLLQRGLRKRPWLTWALTLAVCIPVHLLGWDARLVAVHIPEFLFGMTFLTLAGRTRYILAPLLLARDADGRLLGYACAHRWHPREAYDWSVESTIYCAPDARGCGVGTLLYRALLELLAACGYWNVYALVADPNPASERIHAQLGFSCVGRTPHTAYKFGWLGLSTWWLALRTGNEKPAPVRMVTAEQTQAVLCKYGKTE